MDDETAQPPEAAVAAAMVDLMNRFREQVTEASMKPRYQYEMVHWGQVNQLAAEGWELRAANIELTRFVMARQLGAADEAAAVLAQAAAAQAAQIQLPEQNS